MKKIIAVLLCCAASAMAADPQRPDQQNRPVHETQRFVPIQGVSKDDTPWHGFLALDTKTGQICKTMEVNFVEGMVVGKAPLCIDLYRQYP